MQVRHRVLFVLASLSIAFGTLTDADAACRRCSSGTWSACGPSNHYMRFDCEEGGTNSGCASTVAYNGSSCTSACTTSGNCTPEGGGGDDPYVPDEEDFGAALASPNSWRFATAFSAKPSTCVVSREQQRRTE